MSTWPAREHPWQHESMDEFIFTNFFTGGTNAAVDNRRNVLAIRLARSVGLESEVVDLIKRKRREHLVQITLWQREWQASTSRRPQRGRHHDSWAIREKYVRCA